MNKELSDIKVDSMGNVVGEETARDKQVKEEAVRVGDLLFPIVTGTLRAVCADLANKGFEVKEQKTICVGVLYLIASFLDKET